MSDARKLVIERTVHHCEECDHWTWEHKKGFYVCHLTGALVADIYAVIPDSCPLPKAEDPPDE